MEKTPAVSEKGKTNAIISYITFIGTIIAIVLNNTEKNSFTSFHIRQMIGLSLLSILNQYVISLYINSMLGWIITIGLFVLWIIGFMGVLKGEEKKVPLLGDQFQEWFKNI
ncbi:DUF4870 domain-containing protein [Tenacibaculum ovolyticum]|uniref:DUF4870 domain-containing protein n=1 Tax=Tenacibaculum ovolyticum TaxID=104270 RepID=UPI00041F1B67|nr:hypothetical protein [Tenacibaculum ovolyticum]